MSVTSSSLLFSSISFPLKKKKNLKVAEMYICVVCQKDSTAQCLHLQSSFYMSMLQLNALQIPIPTSVADIPNIPSCLDPILYFVALFMMAVSCFRKFRIPE